MEQKLLSLRIVDQSYSRRKRETWRIKTPTLISTTEYDGVLTEVRFTG